MAELTDKQIRRISQEIARSGLTYTELQEELLDHLCCDVEAEMNDGLEFIKALEKVRKGIGENRIREIQEETLLLINKKYRIMKKFMYVLGILAPGMLLLGSLFKWQNLTGGGILITFSLFLLGAIFIPVYVMVRIRDTRENRKPVNKSLYIKGMITGILFAAAALFRIQAMPGAGILIIISIATALIAFLPAMILNVIREKEYQLQSFSNLVFALCFFAVVFMLISMTVPKDISQAFILTGESIEDTRSVLESRNIALLNTVKTSRGYDESLVNNMNELRTRTVKLNDYIQSLRIEVLVQTRMKNRDAVDDNRNIDLSRTENLLNRNVPAEILVGPNNDGKGYELQDKIIVYHKYLSEMVGTGQDEMINQLLDTGDPEGEQESEPVITWPQYYFEYLPMIAVLNNLSRIQTNILMAENEAMQVMLMQSYSIQKAE